MKDEKNEGSSMKKEYDEKYEEKNRKNENVKINSIEAEKIRTKIDNTKKRKLKSETCYEIKKEERKFKRSMKNENMMSCMKTLQPKLEETVDRENGKLYLESSTTESPSGGQERWEKARKF